jgi:predicted HTH domain antitoxin
VLHSPKGTDVQTITLDEELAEILRSEAGSLEAAASEALVMELFRRGRVSIGKACALLRLPREAFARRADDLGIPYFLINKDDWAAELATIEAWRRS